MCLQKPAWTYSARLEKSLKRSIGSAFPKTEQWLRIISVRIAKARGEFTSVAIVKQEVNRIFIDQWHVDRNREPGNIVVSFECCQNSVQRCVDLKTVRQWIQ